MVLHLVGSLVGLIKVRFHTSIDDAIFRLHYRWTTSFCFLACALVSASEYIGNAIQCMEGVGDLSAKAVNTYCWIKSTFTINSTSSTYSRYGSRLTDYIGTGEYDPNEHTITWHAYYQWVPLFLFFQGCLFYLPHLIWKIFENKTAENLLQGLQYNSMDEDREKKRANIAKYIKATAGHNIQYAIAYPVCEALNLVNVVGQMLLLDKFLQGAFLNFGLKVFSSEIEAPLTSTFPRETMCNFYSYGSDGRIQKEAHMCVLPQNILNEKIFIVMWFWFIALTTISAMELIWRVVVVVSPMVRVQLMEQRGKVTADPTLEVAIRRLHLSDFFLLEIIGKNLDAANFKDLLTAIVSCSDNGLSLPSNSYHPYRHLDEVDANNCVNEAAV